MVPFYYFWCELGFKQYINVLTVGSPTSDKRVEKLIISVKRHFPIWKLICPYKSEKLKPS